MELKNLLFSALGPDFNYDEDYKIIEVRHNNGIKILRAWIHEDKLILDSIDGIRPLELADPLILDKINGFKNKLMALRLADLNAKLVKYRQVVLSHGVKVDPYGPNSNLKPPVVG